MPLPTEIQFNRYFNRYFVDILWIFFRDGSWTKGTVSVYYIKGWEAGGRGMVSNEVMLNSVVPGYDESGME